MKRILFFICIILGITSCKENDIAPYSGEPALELPTTVECEFTDADYVNKTETKGFKVQVRLLGMLINTPRTFALKTMPVDGETLPEVTFEEKYTFKADTIYADAPIVVAAPKGIKDSYLGRVAFQTESAAHQFAVGRKEYSSCEIQAKWNLNPNDGRWTWDQKVWGLYSTSKYAFMMDCFGCTYDKMEHTKDKVVWVNDLYQQYKQDNGPLYDDEKEPAEIFFPVN